MTQPADRKASNIVALLALVPVLVSAHPGGTDQRGCHRDSATRNGHCHPERARASQKSIYSAERPPKAGDEGVLYGPFVAIVDGDTFKAKVQGVVMDFRLKAVDAPERDQPYGDRSTSELSNLIRGRELVLVCDDVDHYGRIIARVWVGNIDVNRELIRRGAAWFDSEFARDEELYEEESAARDAKRGLWGLSPRDRIEPWVWRTRKRGS